MTEETKKEALVKVDREKYHSTKSASGSKSLNNGDLVADALDGLELDECYGVAEKFLTFPIKVKKETCENVDDMIDAYKGLNDGMQRMNIGNRIRGQINKDNVALEKAEAEAEKEGGKPVPKSMKSGEDRLAQVIAPFHKARDKRIKEEEKVKATEAKAKEAEAKAKEKADKKAA